MVFFVFSANQAGGNLGHKHKTVKFDDPLQRSVYNLVEKTKKSRKIASLQIITLFFLNLPKRNSFSNRNFWFALVNGCPSYKGVCSKRVDCQCLNLKRLAKKCPAKRESTLG